MKYLIIEDPPQQIIDYLKTYELKIPVQSEVTREGVSRILAEKGYKAGSTETVRKICRQYGIIGVQRGKNYWYKIDDLDKIPAKM